MIYRCPGGNIRYSHHSKEHTRMTATGIVICSRKPIDGFSLIEVMISLLIFSVGLGGVAMQLLTSISGTSDAYDQSIASTHAASLAALSKLEEVSVSTDFIGLEYATDGDSLAQWRLRLARDLPGSQAVLCLDSTPDDGDTANPSCDGAGPPVIKVLWVNESRQQTPDRGVRRVAVPAL